MFPARSVCAALLCALLGVAGAGPGHADELAVPDAVTREPAAAPPPEIPAVPPPPPVPDAAAPPAGPEPGAPAPDALPPPAVGPPPGVGPPPEAGPPPGAGPGPVAPVTDCDRLAQPPRRVMNPGAVFAEGVDYSVLRWPAARAVCLRAIADFPDEARFVAYAGRAADKSGDTVEAARLYGAAAEAGNAMAQNNLAAMYESGDGKLPRNTREAVRLYRLAAGQFYPDAQTSLATYYATGAGGVRRDDREAVRLWQFTAIQDDPIAQFGLGRMYAEGRGGLARDIEEAVRLWRLAAAGGSTDAQARLRRYGRQ